MRILHVLDHSVPLQSGYTFRTVSILREQRRLGWETAQLTSSKHTSEALEEEAEGFHFYRTRKADGLWSRLPVLRQAAVVRSLEERLEGIASELRPDILHAHSPALNGMAAYRVGKRLGLPTVYELRAFWEDAAVDHGTSREGGPRYRLTRAMETHVLQRSAAVTTICEGIQRDIVSRGIPRARVTVVPNGVDVDKFRVERSRDTELARRLEIDRFEVAGFIGSFYAYEGLSLLIDALPELVSRRPRLRVLLVGGGFQDRSLRDRVRDLNLEGKVVFTGRVPFDDVRRYYDLVDVLVYPRLSMRLTETVTPLKPLEAMAMGKVLLASDVGGHRELVTDGETGVLFRAGSKEGLTNNLCMLLEDEQKRRKIAGAARSFVERERTWRHSVERYRGVYERLLTPLRSVA